MPSNTMHEDINIIPESKSKTYVWNINQLISPLTGFGQVILQNFSKITHASIYAAWLNIYFNNYQCVGT